MPDDPGLEAAREGLTQAQAKLRHLKRVWEGPPARPRAEWARDWRLLRRTLERLRGLFEAWAPALEDAEAQGSPEWQRRRRELEARALAAETALREVERRRGGLDEEHARVLAELERVQEGWRLLREEANPSPAPLPEGTLPALEAKIERLTALWERLSAQEWDSAREYGTIDRVWRWVLSVSLPTLEAKASGTDKTLALPTVRRRLEDLDRRWRRSQEKLRRLLGEEALPQLREQLSEALAREEKLLADLETLRNARTKEESQLQDQARKKEALVAGLTEERDWLKTRVEQGQKDARLWESLAEAARKDMDGLLAQIKEDQGRIEARNKVIEKAKAGLERAAADKIELSKRLEETQAQLASTQAALDGLKGRAREDLARLKVKLQEMSEKLAQAKEQAQDARAAASGGPTGEPLLGALDPIPESGWIKVLETLHAPLEGAFSQLRRLFAAGLPEGHKALLRLAAGSLAQASDMAKAVREFLDEGQAAGAPGRLDPVLEAALAAWEPALRRRGVALVRHVPRDLPQVQARPAALRMAFFQVLKNAYEAMPRGGCLTVKAWLEAGDGQVCVCFTDTGPGFSPEAAARLFTPFHSTKGRLGLGLALLRRIARRAGGEAEAANVEPRGAAVTLRLLVAGAADAPSLEDDQSR